MRWGRRPGREKKKPKKQAAATRLHQHTLYGEVPLIEKTWKDLEGREHSYWTWDYDFRPSLPKGAVRGDPYKQNFCAFCSPPQYFYVDQEKVCVQCNADFVFSAREQKYWYETLGFFYASTAIRCLRCRKRRRSARAVQQRLQRAMERLDAEPDDPAVQLEAAEATIRLRERFGQGDLNRVLHLARSAHKTWPDGHEAIFWQARAHHFAGREEKGRQLLDDFVQLTTKARRNGLRRLRREAAALLDGA